MNAAVLQSTGLAPSELTLPPGLAPAVWGRSGNTWGFWFERPGAAGLLAAHELVRTFVNEQYPLPRLLRLFGIPYMVLVAVQDTPDPAVDKVVADSATSGPWGGEVWHLVSITRSTGALVLPTPKGNRNHRLVEQIRLSKFGPDRYAHAVIAAR
jgi:Zn-dependent protease with chaperone function